MIDRLDDNIVIRNMLKFLKFNFVFCTICI